MNNTLQLTPHEMLELHEIIRSEVVCLKKIQASLAMVTDPSLKSFMELSLQSRKDVLSRYQAFYTESAQQQ